MKRNQAGFTLIELIIVIVILGILAVTAAPKFLDFGGDARSSVLQGVKGSLESASSLIYGKAIIAGEQNAATETLTDPAINIVYGYPAATSTDLTAAAELSDFVFGTPAAGAIRIAADTAGINADDTANENCHVLYTQASGPGIKPVITIVNDGC
ncbi:prepilin-type N-terminal cleavage/methylation domain-containing protein [Arsukibacterium sp.]|uniref:prepilin-type N-terminal cleavage/methylation domain-containing protein n=1 Tax=Arsukibacterium sp. TaxID=1977258 RepID=UPI0035622496